MLMTTKEANTFTIEAMLTYLSTVYLNLGVYGTLYFSNM